MRIFPRVFATHLAIAIGALALLGVGVDRAMEHRAVAALETRLIAEAHTVQTALRGRDAQSLQPFVRELGSASGTRITLVRADGVVVADSEHDPGTMENHASRPEIRAALRGSTGTSERVSGTLGRAFLYVAVPPQDGLIVRTALAETAVADQRQAIRRAIAASFLVAVALALAAASLVARSLARPLAVTAHAVGSLERNGVAHLEETGPEEVREVVRAINAMSEQLDARLDELRNETALRERVLRSMAEGVLLAEPSGSVAYANPAARALLGNPRSLPAHVADEGAHEFDVHHPESRSIRATTAKLDDGRVLVVLQDVTEMRRLEAIRRDFVADASHELKTPVAAVLATAETLEHAIEHDPERARSFVAQLGAEARRLATLVKDLLDLSRIERVRAPSERISLSALADTEIEMMRRAALEKGLGVEARIEDGVEIEGRREDIALALRNVLENAVRYTEEGTITAVLTANRDHAEIAVSDTGLGIPQKDLPRIFERFYRVDKARSRNTGGTGLGLSIVRNVIEAHGGDVRAESELGRGSRFVVTLPLARSTSASSTPGAPST
jgi:two-component system phosphate regulon sensor histidine kinase PhoR